MNIGFVSTRLAGVDGVSLETDKLVKVLDKMGHKCFYCAGELESSDPPGRLVPRMGFQDPVIKELYNEAFKSLFPDPKIVRRIYTQADAIRNELEEFIEDYDIDLLFPQNASTIPLNLPLGIAIRDIVERSRIPAICHHHDFYWERERFMNNGIQDILNTAFPPNRQPIQHIVINTVMQRRLKSWHGIDATYLPNVFDFSNPAPKPDAYANHFREDMGVTKDDILILQPTRVVRRKAIEKAIELVRKLDDKRMILLITGYEGDELGGYGEWLKEEAERSGIRYKFIADWVGTERGEHNGHRVYTLWDIYPHADLVTYPSAYEGFGNALIETIYFRKPFVIHQYPVYLSDIRSTGIRGVEFWHDITSDVLDGARRLLTDKAWTDKMVNENYEIAQREFSFERLEKTLKELLANVQFPNGDTEKVN